MLSDLIAHWISNPLFRQARRRPGKLSIDSGRRYGVAIAWLVNMVGLILLIVLQNSGPIRLLLGLFSLLILALPPFLAYAATVVMVNATQGQHYDLLHVTAISNYRLALGYILSNLFRFRGYLALLVGFTPPIIFWAAVIAVYDCPLSNDCALVPNLAKFFTTLIGFTLFAVNVMGFCLLNSIVGVFLGVWWRSRLMSGLGALAVGLSMAPLFVWAVSGTMELIERNLLLLPIPYLLCALVSLFTCQVVRKAS